jgi:hypothetical protein
MNPYNGIESLHPLDYYPEALLEEAQNLHATHTHSPHT